MMCFVLINKRSFETFVCLDLVSDRRQPFLFQILVTQMFFLCRTMGSLWEVVLFDSRICELSVLYGSPPSRLDVGRCSIQEFPRWCKEQRDAGEHASSYGCAWLSTHPTGAWVFCATWVCCATWMCCCATWTCCATWVCCATWMCCATPNNASSAHSLKNELHTAFASLWNFCVRSSLVREAPEEDCALKKMCFQLNVSP